MSYCLYQDRAYNVVAPQPDTPHLACLGDRLMLVHKHHAEPRFEIAPKDVLTRGYVIGIFPKKEVKS